MLLEFLMELCEIGFGLAGFVGAPRGRPEQGLFQSAIIPAFRQRPSDPRRLRAFQILNVSLQAKVCRKKPITLPRRRLEALCFRCAGILLKEGPKA